MKSLFLGAAILAFAACGSESDDPINPDDPMDPNNPDPDDPPPPPDQLQMDYDDVASLVGASMRTGELSAMLDVVILSEGGVLPDFEVTQGTHFTIAQGTRAGVTFRYQFHCNDEADAILAFCDGNANHSHIKVAIAGNVAGAGMSMSAIDRDGDWAVRDLAVDKPRVGGDSAMAFSASVAGENPASYNLSYTALFDRVRYAPGAVLPLSGKIDFSLVVDRTRAEVQRNFAVAATLVFDGDASATLTLDGSRNYSVDLDTGIAVRL